MELKLFTLKEAIDGVYLLIELYGIETKVCAIATNQPSLLIELYGIETDSL